MTFARSILIAVSIALALRAETATAETRDITFDTIKFPMEKTDTFNRGMLTPEIKKIGNAHVRIRGYILPSYIEKGITQFVLVRDNMECCFGPGAALYD
ncbi:MAG TPA: hypothetical protein VHV77_01650, partial [Pirellulales bacterium]|nr:hypothetical protein [Pirellulales bacterium]